MAGKGIKSYRDLIVWQKAHRSVRKILDVSRRFPKIDESRIIKNQVIRSSTSVAANIAEGFGGNKGRVFQNSLTIARREANETDYWLLLCFEEGYINKEIHDELEKDYSEVRAMLSSLIAKLERQANF